MNKRPKPPRDVSVSTPSRCQLCGSTDSRKIGNRMYQPYPGETSEGQPFTHIVRQRVQCHCCGQMRTDRILENYPDAPPEEE